jgi:hypothetical protein
MYSAIMTTVAINDAPTYELNEVLKTYVDVAIPEKWNHDVYDREFKPYTKTDGKYSIASLNQLVGSVKSLGRLSADKCDNHPLRHEFYVELSRLRWLANHCGWWTGK